MIRAIFGSLERFFGILVENCKGAFDFWLAPIQCRILPVSEDFHSYCEEAADKMRQRGLRVEICSGERMGKLIRNAETSKTPVMCIVGEKEVQSGSLSVRTYKHGDAGSFLLNHVLDILTQADREPDNKDLLFHSFGQLAHGNGC